MVLESLITPAKAEKRPWEMFFFGFLISSIAIFISIQIFKSMTGLVSVFLTVIACVPLMYATIKLEEEKDAMGLKESVLLKEHSKALSFFVFMFFGIMVSYTVWFVFLPSQSVASLFSIQIETIKTINAHVTGSFVGSLSMLSRIFLNNVKVLTFCILFSFFYSAGAIFILTWNASVIAVATGTFIRNNMAKFAELVGLSKFAAYIQIFSIGLFRYMIHGIPEIISYFIAGLAGGIISIAVIRHDFRTKNFEKIILDSIDLILIAIAILAIAAVLEVYVTPIFF